MPILEPKLDQSAILRNLLLASSGICIGLVFGLPPAVGAHEMGLAWLPYGAAVIIIGLVVGLLMSFIASVFLPLADTVVETRVRGRQEEEKTPRIVRLPTDRIVWRELLDLELQEVDEKVTRLRAAADKRSADF
jgi:hypothetical protein